LIIGEPAWFVKVLLMRQAIGLDDEPRWVIASEQSIDEWPNGGLSPVPRKRGEFSYGFIPPGLFAKVRASFLELAKAKKSGAVRVVALGVQRACRITTGS